jgi:hypothetical protein
MPRSLRIALKVVAAYVVACLPSLFVASASGPHGPGFSALEVVALSTWIHWAFIGRLLGGNNDALPFALAFLIIFGVGLIVVWLTERGRKLGTSP